MKLIERLITLNAIIMLVSCADEKNDTDHRTSFIHPGDTIGLVSANVSEDTYLKEFKDEYGADNKDIWGQGIISNTSRNKSETVNFPQSQISVYNAPKGTGIGRIFKQDSDEYYSLYFEKSGSQTALKVDLKDLMEINYEGTCLKYYDKKDNFVQCLVNLVEGGVWINITDLTTVGYSVVDWKTFLLQTTNCCHPVSSQHVLIFDSLENVIDTLKRGFNVVKFMGEVKGDCIKVEIYKEDECGSCTDVKTGDGWINAIDENGHPKVFFHTRGC